MLLEKCVFSSLLKTAGLAASRMSDGSRSKSNSMQQVGFSHARSSNLLVQSLGVAYMYLLLEADRRLSCWTYGWCLPITQYQARWKYLGLSGPWSLLENSSLFYEKLTNAFLIAHAAGLPNTLERVRCRRTTTLEQLASRCPSDRRHSRNFLPEVEDVFVWSRRQWLLFFRRCV